VERTVCLILMLLAAEASGVIALRMMELMGDGRSARREANLMVSEKIKATIEATYRAEAGSEHDADISSVAGIQIQAGK
jgi:hypothetical protein